MYLFLFNLASFKTFGDFIQQHTNKKIIHDLSSFRKEKNQLILFQIVMSFFKLHYQFPPTSLFKDCWSKELSLWHKLWFYNLYNFATQCRRPKIFQTMNSVRSDNLSLKYQRFILSGCQDIGVRKFEFVAKTHFLWPYTNTMYEEKTSKILN